MFLKFFYVFIFTFLSLFLSCNKKAPESKLNIHYGDISDVEDPLTKHVVILGIELKNGQFYHCGGVIVEGNDKDHYFILTAGHCLYNAASVIVLFSTDVEDRFLPERRVNTNEFAVHPSYNPDKNPESVDIGVVRILSHLIPADYKPAKIVSSEILEDFQDFSIRVYGSGQQESGKSGVLKHLDCNYLYSDNQRIIFHGKKENSRTAPGDSGAPVFVCLPNEDCYLLAIHYSGSEDAYVKYSGDFKNMEVEMRKEINGVGNLVHYRDEWYNKIQWSNLLDENSVGPLETQ